MSYLVAPQPELVFNLGGKAGGETVSLVNPGSLYVCEWTGGEGEYLNIVTTGLLVPYRLAVKSNGTRYRFAASGQHRYVRAAAEITAFGRLSEGITQRVAPEGLYDVYDIWMMHSGSPFNTYYVSPLRMYLNADNIGVPVEPFE